MVWNVATSVEVIVSDLFPMFALVSMCPVLLLCY